MPLYTSTSRLFIINILSFLSFFLIHAESRVEKTLQTYKTFLEQGTYAGHDWSCFSCKPQTRYHTFKYAFAHMEKNRGNIIVELGTIRSFVSGRYPGCNSDDPSFWEPESPEKWDWEAGLFSFVAAECLAHLNPIIYTIDIEHAHIQRCKLITQRFNHCMRYNVCSSEHFLRTCNFPKGIDLLYLDTGDIWPVEPTAQLQLREAKIIVERNLIAKNGLILIDDVMHPTPKKFGEPSNLGKSKYALPYLCAHGFEIVMNEFQVILKKK